MIESSKRGSSFALMGVLSLAALVISCTVMTTGPDASLEAIPDATKIDLDSAPSRASVAARTAGCVSCHVGQTDPHPLESDPEKPGRFAEKIGCTDCHGGDAGAKITAGMTAGSPEYERVKAQAHVPSRDPAAYKGAANPERLAAAWLKESWAYVRFVNPGDLRTAKVSCGTSGCHGGEVHKVENSMMTHGAMLWGAALYNNGAFNSKWPRFGESYDEHGRPRRIVTTPAPTPEETATKGVLPFLDPLPRFEVGQPSNILRIFEKGQKKPLLIGLPTPGAPGQGLDDEPGRPANRLSQRGLGTQNRTDPVWLNLQRTRLLDPTLNMPGTNDHPGDYRQSGCTACHVLYANDRDILTAMRQGADSTANHSGPFAKFGNRGQSAQADPTLKKGESGHPIDHLLTRRIPSSQCVVCHMHPGTAVSNTYLGYTWWDLETDGAKMWPAEQKVVEGAARAEALNANPEGSTPKGLWSDPEFLAKTGSAEFNADLKKMQVGDFHGHGFVYRAVWKKDRKGTMLDAKGEPVSEDDPDRWKKAVHLKDIHLEKGMHCVDCHFLNDSHGDGKIYGEIRAATAIKCVDCHGTVTAATNLKTSGNAGPEDLAQSRTPFGKRFRWMGPAGRPGVKLIQQSAVDASVKWTVPQIRDTTNPDLNKDFASDKKFEQSRLAKTMRKDGKTWGKLPGASDASDEASLLAHDNETMECYSCHTSWMASCFGCHLPMRANEKRPALHNEGQEQRNWTSYSFQTIRDDLFMLGKDGDLSGGKIVPVRSACAVMVGSQNQNREWVYSQQQTISAEGYSGTSFSPHFPHSVRATETKRCTDCHISKDGDNNAIMAQLLMLGTNAANFIGRYCYVAEGDGGFDAVVVSEREEPQAVLGSRLHELAWPANAKAHAAAGRVLTDAVHQGAHSIAGVSVPFGSAEVLQVQLRGEYLYAACGTGGLRVYDVAEIDHKGFSERIVSAPVSPLGQDLTVSTSYATSVKAPTTQGVDPARERDPANREQPIHLSYAFLYVTDREEGLILVNAATLLDGDPTNNFLERAVTFNPEGKLKGAVNCTVQGDTVYVCCDRGVVAVSVADPMSPRILGEAGAPHVKGARSIEVQFRYAFVCDAEGVKVLDVTSPGEPRAVTAAALKMANAVAAYPVRTWLYVAAGKDGLAIVDIEKPEAPRLDQTFNAGGALDDARDVKVGMTNASTFAYVADGKNGLRVVQLTSPDETPGSQGFSPRPTPRLIATYPTAAPALFVSEGIDRDRAVDESGHQTGVFGRIGARPLTRAEMEKFYMKDGKVRTVTNDPPGPATEAEKAGSSTGAGTAPAAGAGTKPPAAGPKRPGAGGPPRPGAGGAPAPSTTAPSEAPKAETAPEASPTPAPAPATGPKRPAGPPRPGAGGPPRPGAPKAPAAPATEAPKAEAPAAGAAATADPAAASPEAGKAPGSPATPAEAPKPADAPAAAPEAPAAAPATPASAPAAEAPPAEAPKPAAPAPTRPGGRPGPPRPPRPGG